MSERPREMPAISNLARLALEQQSPLLQGLTKALANPYDVVDNPTGIINLGTAENQLMFPELLEKLNSSIIRKVTPEMLKYGTLHGSEQLRNALAKFFNTHFKPADRIRADQITAHAGCGSTLNNITQVVTNPGDGILIPAPYYGGFDFDLTLYAQARPIPVPTQASNNFAITVEALESAYQTATAANIPIRALLLTNPPNPQGRSFPRSTILPLLQWAKSHSLHAISDEIYALSTFVKPNSFVSVLSYPDLPDPEHTHVVWSMSKDFGINGLRVGICISRNKLVLSAMQMFALFTNTSSLAERAVARLLEDEKWVDWYLEENQRRIREQYKKVASELQRMRIPFLEPDSGFFVLIDLSKWLTKVQTTTKPSEEPWRQFWYKLIDGGVYILPGEAFHCTESGWFRVIFTVPWDMVKLGLTRLERVLLQIEKQNAKL